MRWRNHQGDFFIDSSINKSMSDLFAETMIKMFTQSNNNGTLITRRGFPPMEVNTKDNSHKWPEIRLTSNSLGSSLMVMGQAKILEMQGPNGPSIAKRMAFIGKNVKCFYHKNP